MPIKRVASELGLRLHQIDTFKNWVPPDSINLVVAVSFGLLVPARILTGAKYGGLNVHPSLLPDLRGPAPIIHTLLKRHEHTGVTLQTMHPTQFDHGAILAQTPYPGVPVSPDGNPDELSKTLGPLGAEMLCRGIDSGIFVSPVGDLVEDRSQLQQLDHAPKITAEDRHINWSIWTSDEVLLRDRVLGRLWDAETYSRCFPHKAPKRVAFQGPWSVRHDVTESGGVGEPILLQAGQERGLNLGFCTADGLIVSPTSATIEGEGKGKGLNALVNGIHAVSSSSSD